MEPVRRFFFNGEEISRWASYWHLLPDPLQHRTEDWDEFVDRRHIWHLQCRIDHHGVVESEDPLMFRICAQEMLLLALEHPLEALGSINRHESEPEGAEKIYSEILAGLGNMIALSHAQRRALWTSGGDEDCERLLQAMARLKPHPPFSAEEAEPHVIERHREQLLRSGFQLTALRKFAERPDIPKPVRKLVLELPPNLSD